MCRYQLCHTAAHVLKARKTPVSAGYKALPEPTKPATPQPESQQQE
jgi:hypothetical protein